MAKLFVVTLQPKADPDAWHVVGQTTNESAVAGIVNSANNNTTFVRRKNGDVSGDNSAVEIFGKDDLVTGYGETVNLDEQE